MNNAADFQVKIIDNTFFSIGFPVGPWDKLINRNNYLSQMEDYLANGTEILFIEGDEDSGKTTLCAQFARRNVDFTISVFFNPLNILDYQIEFYCSNVVSQIRNILKEEPYSKDEETFIGTEQYQQCIFQLRKMLKKDGNKINLVIDGLEEKVKVEPDFVSRLFAIVPFGQDIFRIIISGNKTDFLLVYPRLKGEEIKSIVLTGFSEPEIVTYLGLTEYTSNEFRDLYKVTKGFPGRLKTLKRLIQNDSYSLEMISNTTTYKNWLELDCESVDLNISRNNGVLSLLALNDKSLYPFGEIAYQLTTSVFTFAGFQLGGSSWESLLTGCSGNLCSTSCRY